MKKQKKSIYTKITPKIKEDVNKLAKKHFIKQKTKEIILTLLSIFGLIYIPYLIGLLWIYNYGDNNLETFCEGICNVYDIWVMGLLTIMVIALIFIALGGIGHLIWKMIKGLIDSNWNKAYRKAETELDVETEKWGSWDSAWWKRHYEKKKTI